MNIVKILSRIILITFTITNLGILGYVIYSFLEDSILSFPDLLVISLIVLLIPIIINVFLIVKYQKEEFYQKYKSTNIAYSLGALIATILSILFGITTIQNPSGGYDFHPTMLLVPLGIFIIGTVVLGIIGLIIDYIRNKKLKQ